MSGESSEEKSLPPSEKKLREARERGQISKSQDVIAAATLVSLSLYLMLGWSSIMGSFARMFDAAGRAASDLGPGAFARAQSEIWDAMTIIVAPIYLIAFLSIFLGSIISNRGIVFSVHPITPDLKYINPVEGFKKLFSIRNFIEFLKALLKSAILLGGLAIAAWLGLETLMNVPLCSTPCYSEALIATAGPLVFTALTLFIVSALIDTGVQKWLFTRDMRMTHSEQKRELKEMFGDPLLRRARNDQRREGGEDSPRSSMVGKAPTLIIAAGSQAAVAIRYVPGETSAPVVLAKGAGAVATVMIEDARKAGISVANEPQLATELARQSKKFSFVPQMLFKEVARVLVQSRSR